MTYIGWIWIYVNCMSTNICEMFMHMNIHKYIEHFYCGNALPHIIKPEKSEFVFSFIKSDRVQQQQKCSVIPRTFQQFAWVIYMVWFGLVLWYINPCRLFNDISTLVGYLMPNPVNTYNLNMICKHILLITFKKISLRSWFQVFLPSMNNFIYN